MYIRVDIGDYGKDAEVVDTDERDDSMCEKIP